MSSTGTRLPERLLITGQLYEGGGPVMEVDDPSTGRVVGKIRSADQEQVDVALDAAVEAAASWRSVAQPERTALLRAIARAVTENRQMLAEAATVETGRPFHKNLGYVDWTAEIFGFYAELSRVDGGRLAPANQRGQLSLVERVPYGVVAALTPFNYPLALLAQKVAPALGTGNVVVVKPAPPTTATTLLFGEIVATLAPPGVIQVLAGDVEVGRALVEDPRTDFVAFTGSTPVGRQIGETCGRITKPVHLELGGNDAAIVLADIDPRTAGRALAWSAFLNAGQVCTSTERAFVQERIVDAVVEEAVAVAEAVRVGDPWDERTQIGPLRSRFARDRIRNLLRSVEEDGGQVMGGHVPDLDGYFLEPAVVNGVDPSHPLMAEETFGPVLPVVAVDDLDEALQYAADTEFGLGATLYTHDPSAVGRALERLEVGNLWINDPVVENLGAPFGGVRASGNARELGLEGLHSFSTVRHTMWTLRLEERNWWFSKES